MSAVRIRVFEMPPFVTHLNSRSFAGCSVPGIETKSECGTEKGTGIEKGTG